MPKGIQDAPEDLESGKRWREVRQRLGYEEVVRFAEAIGIKYPTYAPWETKNKKPLAPSLKRAVASLARTGVQDALRLAWWLADGVGDPPFWLYTDADPLKPAPGSPPSGPGGVLIAMPEEALEAGREAFRILDGARAANGLRDDASMTAFLCLKRITIFREPPTSAEESPVELQVSPATPLRTAA